VIWAFLRTLAVFGKIVGGMAALVFAVWGTALAVGGLGVVGDLMILLVNGWAVYAFLRYRQGRQAELVDVMAAAVAGGVPIESAVRIYAKEHPRRSQARFLFDIATFFLFPLYLYVRLWIGWKRYDSLVAILARRLEEGRTLTEALQLVPGVVPRDVVLAAAIGEATGTLPACLREAQRERWSAVWLEVAPRVVYPLVVLLTTLGTKTFFFVMILPKYVRIYQEFGLQLPEVTQAVRDFSFIFVDSTGLLPLSIIAIVVAISAYMAMPALRWRTPLVGRLYRWGIQAEVLRALGRLFAAGRTVPDSLKFIRNSGVYPGIVRTRLSRAAKSAEAGATLEQALVESQLLPTSMAPLVKAAQATNTLGWALEELGEHLAGRAVKLVRRISLVVAPMLILAIAAFVAFIALALFLPLVQLIEALTEL
jgi:type IV pilus assembly protein PilC